MTEDRLLELYSACALSTRVKSPAEFSPRMTALHVQIVITHPVGQEHIVTLWMTIHH